MFERKIENIYVMKILNNVNCVHDTKANNISEWNLGNDKPNNSKCTKDINSQYYPIIHVFMNTHRGKEKINRYQIWLDSGFSSTIVMINILKNLKLNKMLWYNDIYKKVILPLIWKLK